MKYTLFVIDGGYLDDANDTVTIQGCVNANFPLCSGCLPQERTTLTL